MLTVSLVCHCRRALPQLPHVMWHSFVGDGVIAPDQKKNKSREEPDSQRTQGPRIYFDTGDLSTLEYLYDLRCISASSEMHSAAAFSRRQGRTALAGRASLGFSCTLRAASQRARREQRRSSQPRATHWYWEPCCRPAVGGCLVRTVAACRCWSCRRPWRQNSEEAARRERRWRGGWTEQVYVPISCLFLVELARALWRVCTGEMQACGACVHEKQA